MIKPDGEKILSPRMLFFSYLLLSSAAVFGFAMIFPGKIPLPYFSMQWRLVMGGENLVDLFPALALSALVIPFGINFGQQEKYTSFSPKFIKDLSPFIFNAIVCAAIFAFLSFLVLPLITDHKTDLQAKGDLYYLSAERARVHANQGEWQEASQFLDICERIWPDAPGIAGLVTETSIRLDEMGGAQETPVKGAPVTRQDITSPSPLSASESLAMAETAMKEERYFDAHWLATLAGDLAAAGSAESAAAARLASQAWNAVSSLEPTSRQTEAYRIYYLRRDAYRALISNEWIQAYYLFQQLLSEVPGDPDGIYFLGLSEQGLVRTAFFIDEIEVLESPAGALFSVPYIADAIPAGSRLVIRFGSLSLYPDVAYGIGLEILAFDQSGKQLWRIDAPYAKIVPLANSTGNGNSGPRISILMHALDRQDSSHSWSAATVSFAAAAPSNTQLFLNIDWDDFVLLSKINRGYGNLNPAQLLAASGLGAGFGYLPQIFQAGLISRFAGPMLFLPLLVLVLAAGWRLRARQRPRYMWLPMLGILPVVFNGVFQVFIQLTDSTADWTVLLLGFPLAVVVFSAAFLILFILSLIILSAQHG